ncbi:septin-5-like [Latimeria chalumnae]|uniref:septin-5-like n=1 Tax=Latimeria chalumnae TaxID=7897 RepID=UPI00313E5D42
MLPTPLLTQKPQEKIQKLPNFLPNPVSAEKMNWWVNCDKAESVHKQLSDETIIEMVHKLTLTQGLIVLFPPPKTHQHWKSMTEYIDQQFEQYFRDESGLNRKNIQDNRVRCLLYFISPYGHGLRPLDVEFMKAIHHKVNIMPIIAKADTLTPAEIKKMKQDEIEEHDINIYQFPDRDSDEDEEFKKQDTEPKDSIPFAVIGSNGTIKNKDRAVRGRLYPWGVVEAAPDAGNAAEEQMQQSQGEQSDTL